MSFNYNITFTQDLVTDSNLDQALVNGTLHVYLDDSTNDYVFGASGNLTVTYGNMVDHFSLIGSSYDGTTFEVGSYNSDESNYQHDTVDFTFNANEMPTTVPLRYTIIDSNIDIFQNPAAPVVVVSVCFAGGTRIRTLRGETAVETLRVGDLVVTASGVARPICWLGHRTIDCRHPPLQHEAQPICIAAHAFGWARPARDLYLSPGHPVLVGADADGAGGHLVPIMCLINGTTIERVPVDEVTYWHVELDEHDVLLAEGLPAESYIDLGSRPWFAGTDGALYDPDGALPDVPGRCRPVAIDGPVVEAERRRLDQVFATRLIGACAWPASEDQPLLTA